MGNRIARHDTLSKFMFQGRKKRIAKVFGENLLPIRLEDFHGIRHGHDVKVSAVDIEYLLVVRNESIVTHKIAPADFLRPAQNSALDIEGSVPSRLIPSYQCGKFLLNEQLQLLLQADNIIPNAQGDHIGGKEISEIFRDGNKLTVLFPKIAQVEQLILIVLCHADIRADNKRHNPLQVAVAFQMFEAVSVVIIDRLAAVQENTVDIDRFPRFRRFHDVMSQDGEKIRQVSCIINDFFFLFLIQTNALPLENSKVLLHIRRIESLEGNDVQNPVESGALVRSFLDRIEIAA